MQKEEEEGAGGVLLLKRMGRDHGATQQARCPTAHVQGVTLCHVPEGVGQVCLDANTGYVGNIFE